MTARHEAGHHELLERGRSQSGTKEERSGRQNFVPYIACGHHGGLEGSPVDG